MRQSAKETVMLHMQAECTFCARESSILVSEPQRTAGMAAITAGDPAKSPWLKPGR